eukprot:13668903-Alexandrium_andersonii.AAC.1
MPQHVGSGELPGGCVHVAGATARASPLARGEVESRDAKQEESAKAATRGRTSESSETERETRRKPYGAGCRKQG